MRYIKSLIIFSFLIALVACEKDDFTGYSRLRPTSPVITVTLPDQVELDDPAMDEFDINVTMSEPQIVDVAIHSSQVEGNAESEDDYEIEGRIIIKKGQTTGHFTLHINSDELANGERTATFQIGDGRTANASIAPVQFSIDRN